MTAADFVTETGEKPEVVDALIRRGSIALDEAGNGSKFGAAATATCLGITYATSSQYELDKPNTAAAHYAACAGFLAGFRYAESLGKAIGQN